MLEIIKWRLLITPIIILLNTIHHIEAQQIVCSSFENNVDYKGFDLKLVYNAKTPLGEISFNKI